MSPPSVPVPATALLVIDVQRGLFDGAPRPFEADTVVDRINALAARARTAGVPVVFVQHERDGGALARGSEGWRLEARLDVRDEDTVVNKTTPDSFLRTSLGEHLAAWGTQRVVICGYASEFCVDTTTRRAAALGWPVILASDAHTTHDKAHATAAEIRRHHNATLPDIGSFGPEIRAVPAADIAFDRADGVAGEAGAPGGSGAPAASSRVTVRTATRDDLPALHRIRHAVRENRIVRLRLTDADYIDAMERTGRGWVAERDGRVIGFAVGNGQTGNIWALFVDPAEAASGAGRALHDAMLAWLHTLGLPRLWLTTQPGTRADRFYARAGWTRGAVAGGEVAYERPGAA
jgi:nicotinamidase-related amidase/N-acetylglutamate synthase-like GNAT family acetyltransferase